MEQDQDIKWIENYFDGILSSEEEEDFLIRLEHDFDFRESVRAYELFVLAMEKEGKRGREDWKQYLHELEVPANSVQSRRQKIIKLVWLSSAAVACLLILFLTTDIFQSNGKNLAEEFYIQEPGLPILMGDDRGELHQAMKLYSASLLDESYEMLQQLPISDTVFYFMGVIDYRRGRIEMSLANFQKVESLDSSVFLPDTYYRIALIFILNSNYEAAAGQLEALLQFPENTYTKHAAELLEAIKEQGQQ
jgi:tetratricopeptide (TPR) repeat protein